MDGRIGASPLISLTSTFPNLLQDGGSDRESRELMFYKRQKATGYLEQYLAQLGIGESRGHMHNQTSHVATYWMSRVFDGASIVSGTSVNVAKTWGYPRKPINDALERAGLEWPAKIPFDERKPGCRIVPLPPAARHLRFADYTPPGRIRSTFEQVLEIALFQLDESDTSWYISTGQLQLVSFDVASLVRAHPVANVVVDNTNTIDPLYRSEPFGPTKFMGRTGNLEEVEPRLLDLLPLSGINLEWQDDSFASDIIPLQDNLRGVRVLSLVGDIHGTDNYKFSEIQFPIGLLVVRFGGNFDHSLDDVVWPETVEEMSFVGGSIRGYDKPLDYVTWPARLKKLSFDTCMNPPIANFELPATLEIIHLGGMFNQSIAQVQWPASLKYLSFGVHFSHPLASNKWPEGLISIKSRNRFDTGMAGVVLPPRLEHLALGGNWNGSIEGVSLPQTLEVIEFGGLFNMPLRNVQWPGATRVCSFAGRFNQEVHAVQWSGKLQVVRFGDSFDKYDSLSLTEWPHTVREMEVGQGWNDAVPLTTWPDTLQRLVFGGAFDGSMEGAMLPPSLVSLAFGHEYKQPITGLGGVWPPALEELSFGKKFKGELWPVEWPPAIADLQFEGISLDDASSQHCMWPRSLKRVRFQGGGGSCSLNVETRGAFT